MQVIIVLMSNPSDAAAQGVRGSGNPRTPRPPRTNVIVEDPAQRDEEWLVVE